MKKRSAYCWVFLASGAVWAVGGTGVVLGMFVYPESNLLGGLGLIFGPISLLGSSVFQLAFVVWIIHKISNWWGQRRC